MGKTVIAVSKEHGFHEPRVVTWRLPEDNPDVVKARMLGIDIDYILDIYRTRARNWKQALGSELKAMELARKDPDWRNAPFDLRLRVRAVLAERLLRDARQETEMLKKRLKQSDNGAADWVDEREALQAQIRALEEQIKAGGEDERVVNMRKELDEALDTLENYERTSKTLTDENRALKESNVRLHDENEALKERNARLHKDLTSYEKDNQYLADKNKEFLTEIENLTDRKDNEKPALPPLGAAKPLVTHMEKEIDDLHVLIKLLVEKL